MEYRVVFPYSHYNLTIRLPVAVIVASSWLAVPFAPVDQQGPTGSLALVTTIFAMLVFVPQSGAVWRWLVVGAVLHAVVLLYGLYSGDMRPAGLAHNPNPAAGFLVVMLAYRLARRIPDAAGLALPAHELVRRVYRFAPYVVDGLLLAGIAVTGSRWAAAVTAVVMVGIAVKNYIRRKISWILKLR